MIESLINITDFKLTVFLSLCWLFAEYMCGVNDVIRRCTFIITVSFYFHGISSLQTISMRKVNRKKKNFKVMITN
jgi:hypothetical protein